MDNEIPKNTVAMEAISHRIQKYEDGKIKLPQLAQELHVILGNIDSLPQEWLSKAMGIWGAIEEVNALALCEGKEYPLPAHQNILDDALKKLRKVIDEGKA